MQFQKFPPCVSWETQLQDLEVQLIKCDEILKLRKTNFSKAHSRIKTQDKNHRELNFNIGDLITSITTVSLL